MRSSYLSSKIVYTDTQQWHTLRGVSTVEIHSQSRIRIYINTCTSDGRMAIIINNKMKC